MRQTVDLYEDLAEDRGLSIHVDTHEDVWVHGDRRRLRQVLANLVDNAVKYTPAGGRIELRTAREGREAVVTVEDTGIGIAPRGAAAHLGAPLSRRQEPLGTRAGPRAQPGQGHRPGARRNGDGPVTPGRRQRRSKFDYRATSASDA